MSDCRAIVPAIRQRSMQHAATKARDAAGAGFALRPFPSAFPAASTRLCDSGIRLDFPVCPPLLSAIKARSAASPHGRIHDPTPEVPCAVAPCSPA
jgi:hypothetical protein